MTLTQRERILFELRQAGEAGVRSDTFFRLNMPRAAARIQELRDAGHNITSERCGKFVTYRLVGVEGESGAACDVDAEALGHSLDSDATPAGVHSGPQAAGRALPGASPLHPQSAPEPLFGGYEIQEAA